MARAGISGQLRLEGEQWRAALQQAEREAQGFTTRVNRTMSRAGSGGGSRDAQKGATVAAQTALQMGYIVDDLQYGLRGVTNNIAPLLSRFGTWGMLMAGVGTAAAVAFNKISGALGSEEGAMERVIEGNRAYLELMKKRDEWQRKVAAEAHRFVQIEAANIALAQKRAAIEEQRFAAMMRTADLRRQLALAEARSLPEEQQPQAVAQIEAAGIDEQLDERERFLQRQLAQQEQARDNAVKELQALRERQQELADMREKNIEQLREEAEIGKRIEAQELRRSAALQGIMELQRKVDAVRREREEDAPLQKRIIDQNAARQEEAIKRREMEEEAARVALRAELEIQELRESGLREAAKQKESELRMEQRILALKRQGFAEEEAAAIATREAALRAAQERREAARQEMDMARTLLQMRANELRAAGRTDEAKRLERRMQREDRQRQLEAQGFTSEEARALVRREERVRGRIEEEEERKALRARGKIIGAGHRSRTRRRRGEEEDEDEEELSLAALRRSMGLPDPAAGMRRGMGMEQRGVFEQRAVPQRRAVHEQRAQAAEKGAPKMPQPDKADPALISAVERTNTLLANLVNIVKTGKANRANN